MNTRSSAPEGGGSNFPRRSVMIPLGSASARHGRVAYAHADGAKPCNDAKLIPEIALLNDCRLYQAGTIALAAVRQAALKPSPLAVTQWLGRTMPAYLSVSNAPDLYGLTPENSASAQLGLALVLAMYQCQSEAKLVIATGELLTRGDLSHARDGTPDDVPVGAVGLIGEKLETVIRLLDDYKGGAFSPSIPFFFPKYTVSGEETLAAHAPDFERAAAAYRARGIGLKFYPVTTLREALRVLGLKRIRPTSLDRAALLGAAGAAMLGVFTLAVQYWLAQPIPLTFAPVVLTSGEALASPFPARQLKDGSVEQSEACFSPEGMPLYPSGGWIVMRVRIGKPGAWGGGHYHFAVIGVSERSGVKVFPPEAWNGSPEDREASLRLPIKEGEEANKLIVLAQRLRPFDTEALREKAAAAVAASPPDEHINAVVNALVRAAPGYIDYSFQSVKGDLPCER